MRLTKLISLGFLLSISAFLARELENAEIDNRNLRGRVKTEQTSKKVIQRRLEAINAQSPFSRPPNFYELLFLPHGATTSTIKKHFKTLAMLCHPDKGGREDMSKSFFKQRKSWKTRRPVKFIISTGLKKHKNIMTRKWTFETLAV